MVQIKLGMDVSIHQIYLPILNSHHSTQMSCTTACRLVTIHACATLDANSPSHLVATSSSHSSISENFKAPQLLQQCIRAKCATKMPNSTFTRGTAAGGAKHHQFED
ncbi:Uncharacterized protein Fot_28472 [Forsythia ovata]|uniref:Uncharacterized protein n=1 Tax=Forsythia ovata TaxID=205694 RepID=A0ABD1TP37_9LAMI